jgi:hypothetical protein
MSTVKTRAGVRYEPEERPGYLDSRPAQQRRDPEELARERRRAYCRRLVRDWKRRKRRAARRETWIAGWLDRLAGEAYPHGYRGVAIRSDGQTGLWYGATVELAGRRIELAGQWRDPLAAAAAIAAYLVDQGVSPEGA